jgi:serine/threonine-protein kinase
MASVWLARLHGKRGFERLVVVKTILPRFAQDPRFETMFLDEARIASGINHTNVARVLDLGEEHGVLYIAMEWVDGDSLGKLQRLLARAGVPLPQAFLLRIMADACAGLHAAHELRDRDGAPLGIVHRDVSPQNILVSSEGMAKIIDFGVAKARDRASDETSAGSLKGKIQYMAPEQALGRPVDRRADVWAVGAILYYFFSGRKVYEADTELGTLHRLTSGAPPVPLPPSVPRVVVDIIRGLLRFRPEDRTADLDIVRKQLEYAIAQLEVTVRPEDIARFIATHAQERAVLRKATVANALQAADARVALAMEAPTSASSSGLIDVRAREPNSLLTSVVPPGVGDASTRAPGAEASSATFGFAAQGPPRPPRIGPLGLVFGGIAALGVLAAGVAGLIFVLRGGAGSNGSKGASPQAAAVVAAAAPRPSAASVPSASPAASAPPVASADAWEVASAAPAEPSSSATAEPLPPVVKPVAKSAPPSARTGAAAQKPPGKRGSKASDTETDDGF